MEDLLFWARGQVPAPGLRHPKPPRSHPKATSKPPQSVLIANA